MEEKTIFEKGGKMQKKRRAWITGLRKGLKIIGLVFLFTAGSASGWYGHIGKLELFDPYFRRAEQAKTQEKIRQIPLSDRAWIKQAPDVVRAVACQFGDIITELAHTYNTDPKLVAAIIAVESRGDPIAKSKSGALGLMQLMPRTARAMGVRNIFDPKDNIAGGIKYLKVLEKDHEVKDLSSRLVAYNRGPVGLKKLGGKFDAKKDQYSRMVADAYRAHP